MAKKTFLWKKWKALRVPSDYESHRLVAKECHQAESKYHATVETNLIRKNNVGSSLIMSIVSLALNQRLLVQSRNQMVH